MDIDFVILWVDGGDEKWQEEKFKHSPKNNKHIDNSENRYRDWGNLKYWFRGVEVFAPWVRKIHFVTCGHIPKWLNTNHPKLNIVNHEDFIPSEYLPTFNANSIELNIHRIKGLADYFVYFNDDIFPINYVEVTDFFVDRKPCDIVSLDVIAPIDNFSKILFNNLIVINKYYKKKDVMKTSKKKWLKAKYGKQLFKTILLWPWPNFTGFYNPHLAIAFNKETFNLVWEHEFELLHQTSLNKFRSDRDVNAWLMRYWRSLEGNFTPISSIGDYFGISNDGDCQLATNYIEDQKNKIICINDEVESYEDFINYKNKIVCGFKKILPQKSKFELTCE